MKLIDCKTFGWVRSQHSLIYMDKIEAKEFDNYRDRQSESKRPGSDVGLRRSSRTPKVSREYAEYVNEIRSKRLKHDL